MPKRRVNQPVETTIMVYQGPLNHIGLPMTGAIKPAPLPKK